MPCTGVRIEVESGLALKYPHDEPTVAAAEALLADMVQIPSVNPDFAPMGAGDVEVQPLQDGRYGEAGMAAYVADFGRRLGLDVEVEEVASDRPNVLIWVPGRVGKRTLMFQTHMDTVQADQSAEAGFQPEIRDGLIYGRGACDAKGCLTAMMLAIQSLSWSDRRPDCNVLLAACVDEETNHAGVDHLVQTGPPVDGAVVGEPTLLQAVVAHKGVMRLRVITTGRASHGAVPREGINAIYLMNDVIRAVREDLEGHYDGRPHPLVGTPSISANLIYGGTGVNTIPEQCSIEIDRRLVPGEQAEEVLAEIRQVIEGALPAGTEGSVEVEAPFLQAPPMEADPTAAVVTTLQDVLQRQGRSHELLGVPYGTDASFLSMGGVPTVVFGPGSIAQAHSADEHVALAQVVDAARILAEMAQRFEG